MPAQVQFCVLVQSFSDANRICPPSRPCWISGRWTHPAIPYRPCSWSGCSGICTPSPPVASGRAVIHADNISKYIIDGKLGHQLVLRDASFSVPTDRSVAILSGDALAATTLLSLLTGTKTPDKGKIVAERFRASPIMNHRGVPGGALIPQMTATGNIRLLADLHGVDPIELLALVESVCRFGSRLDIPVSKFDWPMLRAFEVTVTAALPFDCYFIDRLHSVDMQVWRLVAAARGSERGFGVFYAANHAGREFRGSGYGSCARQGPACGRSTGGSHGP